jgi:hypothetical protein
VQNGKASHADRGLRGRPRRLAGHGLGESERGRGSRPGRSRGRGAGRSQRDDGRTLCLGFAISSYQSTHSPTLL